MSAVKDRKFQPAAKKRRRGDPFDPRQKNLLLPIRGASNADAAAPPATGASVAGGNLHPMDSATYRAELAAALRGDDDATIAEWARGVPRAAKNWRHGVNGADAPSLINMAQPGKSKSVRAFLLAAIGAVEPADKGRKAS